MDNHTKRFLGAKQIPFYNTWASMKHRCYYPKHNSYPEYGGRGIKICNKWMTFKGFYEDMASTYKVGLSIDRIDNDGDYCKENCKWSTPKEQANNTRRNRMITYMGITDTLQSWADYLGLKKTTLHNRLNYYGWSIERSLQEGTLIG